jgi:hypothetical protein
MAIPENVLKTASVARKLLERSLATTDWLIQ